MAPEKVARRPKPTRTIEEDGMSGSKNRQLAVPLILLVMTWLFIFPHSTHGQALPSRAFDVTNGSVHMQGGLLGLRDEIMLFIVLANETQQTVWAAVEIQLPRTGTLLQGFERIRKGDTRMYRWPVPKVVWDTEYPFSVSVFEDKKREKPLGTEQSFFFFEGGADREAFEDLRGKLAPGEASAINGFRELTTTSLNAEVTGTVADRRLQADITQRLFVEESKLHKECEHNILKAEPYLESDRSIIAAQMGGRAAELERGLRAKGDMVVEKWFVQSCDAENVYEVLLLKSGSGTDIMVRKLDSAQ